MVKNKMWSESLWDSEKWLLIIFAEGTNLCQCTKINMKNLDCYQIEQNVPVQWERHMDWWTFWHNHTFSELVSLCKRKFIFRHCLYFCRHFKSQTKVAKKAIAKWQERGRPNEYIVFFPWWNLAMFPQRWRCSAEPTTRPRLSGNLSRVLDINLFSIFDIYLISGQVDWANFYTRDS